MEQNFDYKNVKILEKYLDAQGRIKPSAETGLAPKQQKQMAVAVKRARILALLPYPPKT